MRILESMIANLLCISPACRLSSTRTLHLFILDTFTRENEPIQNNEAFKNFIFLVSEGHFI